MLFGLGLNSEVVKNRAESVFNILERFPVKSDVSVLFDVLLLKICNPADFVSYLFNLGKLFFITSFQCLH